MELETVKIISRNEAIRGLTFDVYFNGEGEHITIGTIEDVTGVQNLKDTFSESMLDDVKLSLNEVLTTRRLRNLTKGFTQDEINDGYVSDAIKNNERGWSNE